MLGERIGNWTIIRRIGEGGMGEVFLAEHETLQTLCAVKLLFPHYAKERKQVERFFDEARAVAVIHHAGIVKIHDAGFTSDDASGRAYLAMDYLQGETLGARLERGRLSHPVACELAQQIASVLDAAHASQVIHRDLKPDNLFLVPDQELGERVKVLDFGIAKLSGLIAPRAATMSQTAMGTPLYMAPEQAKDASKVDRRADIYALGCIVFEMLCGRPPFLGTTTVELLKQHEGVAPPAARSLVPDLPPALDRLIAKMLAKAPGDRPQEMRELVETFKALRAAPAVAPSARSRLRPFALAVGGGGAAIAAVLATRACVAEPAPVVLDAATDGVVDDAALDLAVELDGPAAPSFVERVASSNPFVAVTGATFSVMTRQVSREEYGWFLASLDRDRATRASPLRGWGSSLPNTQPVSWVAFEQAAAFCEQLDAVLPTYDEWRAFAADRQPRAVLGPLREWTSTRYPDDQEMVLVVKPKLGEHTIAKTTNPLASDEERASETLGFRCVRHAR